MHYKALFLWLAILILLYFYVIPHKWGAVILVFLREGERGVTLLFFVKEFVFWGWLFSYSRWGWFFWQLDIRVLFQEREEGSKILLVSVFSQGCHGIGSYKRMRGKYWVVFHWMSHYKLQKRGMVSCQSKTGISCHMTGLYKRKRGKMLRCFWLYVLGERSGVSYDFSCRKTNVKIWVHDSIK